MEIHINRSFLHKLASGKASEEEIAYFNNWLETLNAMQFQEFIDDYQKILLMQTPNDDADINIWNDIEQKINRYERNKAFTKLIKLTGWIAAASIFLAVALSIVFLSKNDKNPMDSQQLTQKHIFKDINPGSNKAILKLADGSTIILGDNSHKMVVLQSSSFITTTKNGQLVYETKVNNSDAGVTYNTIETPKGGQYKVILPDGTKVWLNASSSLKFPTVFKGRERRVEMSGEGYFEVAKDAIIPFIVSTEREVVKVLGTHFNINSYKEDKYSRTTLVEGKVKVSFPIGDNLKEEQSIILKPGQQSVINENSMNVITTDIQETLAWKNGEFMFNNEDIEDAMIKIARWYDVEIVYPRPIKRTSIWGAVSRFKNISEVLKVLELTGSIHFKVEGRKVYVTN